MSVTENNYFKGFNRIGFLFKSIFSNLSLITSLIRNLSKYTSIKLFYVLFGCNIYNFLISLLVNTINNFFSFLRRFILNYFIILIILKVDAKLTVLLLNLHCKDSPVFSLWIPLPSRDRFYLIYQILIVWYSDYNLVISS